MDITANELMQMIGIKYSKLQEDEECIKSKPESGDSIALQSQVNHIKKAIAHKYTSRGSAPKGGSTKHPPL